jgi:hypothetical protein
LYIWQRKKNVRCEFYWLREFEYSDWITLFYLNSHWYVYKHNNNNNLNACSLIVVVICKIIVILLYNNSNKKSETKINKSFNGVTQYLRKLHTKIVYIDDLAQPYFYKSINEIMKLFRNIKWCFISLLLLKNMIYYL